MKEITITNFADYIDKAFHDAYDEGIKRYRTSYIFRGLGNKNWLLNTSLQRHCGTKSNYLEESLNRNFEKYASDEIRSIDGEQNIWKILALGQHHGLPTRLLDWTYSPLIALHFAVDNMDLMNEDSVVYMVNSKIINKNLPSQMRKILENENSYVFTDKMLHSLYTSLNKFDNVTENDFLAIFEPPAFDNRIINQFGLFTIANGAEKNINKILEDNECVKLIIPSRIKMEIRDYLDQMNINERILFPGLDGLSKWLQRHYKPYEIWEKDKK